MTTKNDGGPAFPITDSQTVHRISAAACEGITDPTEKDKVYLAAAVAAAGGMSLRDYFAAHAPISVQDALIAEGFDTSSVGTLQHEHFIEVMMRLAEMRMDYAEAMIAERAK